MRNLRLISEAEEDRNQKGLKGFLKGFRVFFSS